MNKLIVIPIVGIAAYALSGGAGASISFTSIFEREGEKTVPPKQSNMTAFLAMIRVAETGFQNGDERQYRTLFGSTPTAPVLFSGFADHPRIAKPFTNSLGQRLYTTAAGAYQAFAISKTPSGMTKVNTWDVVKGRLKLPDFSPASQDKFAEYLIREKGAYDDILNGRFFAAVQKLSSTWRSLPGGGSDQPAKKPSDLFALYQQLGGVA